MSADETDPADQGPGCEGGGGPESDLPNSRLRGENSPSPPRPGGVIVVHGASDPGRP